jgi:hypothetical protein
MREHVTIGMTDRTFIEGNRDAANDKRAAFRKAVEVVADSAADSNHEKYSFLRGREDSKANSDFLI